MNRSADVVQALNEARLYEGKELAPPFDGALLRGAPGGWEGTAAAGTAWNDGQVRRITNGDGAVPREMRTNCAQRTSSSRSAESPAYLA